MELIVWIRVILGADEPFKRGEIARRIPYLYPENTSFQHLSSTAHFRRAHNHLIYIKSNSTSYR